ncbi:MAG TPA: GTPase domain-containing protein [Polyangiales bacterium]|nr:GTPase domain-containing protein [Polyangiales bacterium]
MAVLDREREVIVIRVVYDGPPEAGKTTSLRALAGSLGQKLHSPAEDYGRTLYFDWMDYTAGRFEGYQIRCQIVSVPGQQELRQRRWRLIKDADVVVFVGDSSDRRLLESVAYLRELSHFLRRTASPPVGVIFQANKRDLPNVTPLDELRELVHATGPGIGVVESIATDGTGIRETFVFAVRLALDRARELLQANALPVGGPDIDTSDDLLEHLRSRESMPPPQAAEAPAAVPLIRQVLAENDLTQVMPWHDVSVPVGEEERPRSPDPSAPSGSIWPPVEGRVILQEAASTSMTTHRLRSGGWTAGLGHGWRIFSSAGTEYNDVEAGRETLVRVARMHAACKSLLSVNRCIVLANTGQGTWRLWQIVRAERPLRDRLNDIQLCSTTEAAIRIVEVATQLCEIGTRMRSAPCNLPCTLDTVGWGERGPVYVGLMPMEPVTIPVADLTFGIGSQLGSIVRDRLQDRRSDVLAAIARELLHNQTPHSSRILDEVLTELADEPKLGRQPSKMPH